MTEAERVFASKKISKIDWNTHTEQISLKTYWCRVAFNKFESWNYKKHSHSFFELHFALKGKCDFSIDGQTVSVSKDEFVLIPPGKTHQIMDVSNDFEKLVWGFSVLNEDVSTKLNDGCSKISTTYAPKEMAYFTECVLENMSENMFGNYSFSQNCLYNIFILLVRSCSDFVSCGFEPKLKKQSMTHSVRKFIRDNLSNNVCLSDAADNFYMSERQLSRIYKEETGKTFRDAKAEIQTETIKNLLSDTELSLEEIALKTGFCDRYSLSKFFKKQDGMSPGEFRNSLKK